MATYAYLRVSTDEQAESGAGLAAQQNACEAYAKRSKTELAGTFKDEGFSGAASLEKRPGLMDAINALERGDVLVVAKRDRLGRDPIVVAMIESAAGRKGARIISAAGEGTEADSPSDVLMRRMIDAFAEYERLIIKARTAAALQAKKRRAERVGSVPFGFILDADGVHLQAHPEEQQIIAKARYLAGRGRSLRAIATALAEAGMLSRSGRPFAAIQVQRMLAA